MIIIKPLKYHLVIDCTFFYMNNWRCFVLKPTSSKGAPEQRTNRVIHLVHLIQPHTIRNVQVGTQTNRDDPFEPASRYTERTNKSTEKIQSSFPPIMRKNQRRCYGLLQEEVPRVRYINYVGILIAHCLDFLIILGQSRPTAGKA